MLIQTPNTVSPKASTIKAPVISPPWALYSWPTVFLRANARRRPRFMHLATRVTSVGDELAPSSGHTVWGRFSGEGDAGIAWDWVEIGYGVVAMVDPMRVVTNLQLLALDGKVLPASEAALHFNQFVRRLPWQDEVRRLLKI